MADYLKIATAMLATRRWERLISPRDLAELLREHSDRQERELRKTLWLGHGCPISALYGDDGEMQCSLCRIDFSRMPVADIARVLRKTDNERHRCRTCRHQEYCSILRDYKKRLAPEFGSVARRGDDFGCAIYAEKS